MPRISVRYGIPCLILLFTAALAAYTVHRDRSSAEAVIRGEAVTRMINRVIELQRQINAAFSQGYGAQVAEGMSFLDREPEPQVAILADDTTRVLGATRREWVGHPLVETTIPELTHWQTEPLEIVVDRVRSQQAGEIHLAAAGRYLLGVYPILMDDPGGEPQPGKVGVLIVQKDLARDLARARSTVEQHTMEMVGMLATLAVVLGILVHFLVTRRLAALVNATLRFAGGDLDARSRLKGRDEVALLGRAFDRMARQVADTQRQLESRVRARTRELAQTVSELQKEVVERRRAENALVNEKERIQVTLASIGDAVVTADISGRIEYLNPVAERLTGWSKEEAVGQPLYQVFRVVDEITRNQLPDPVLQCLRDGNVVPRGAAKLLLCRDGEERSIDDSVAPIFDRERVIIGAVVIFRDVTEARRIARQLSYHASHDALTGLVNRREFERRVERVLGAGGQGESHAILYLDLDQFKVVNDTCGHVAGDELLRQVGTTLTPRVRKRDTLARLGGDEFGILLEHCPQDQAVRIAEQMREALQDIRFVWQDRCWTIGASIGLVPIDLGTDNLASVLRAADSACYVAKEQGRNRVHVYQPDDRELSQRHGEMQWIPRIQEALSDDRLTLYSQPIIPLRPGGQPHCEVLLRLLNRDGGLVPPAAFIPAAERYNQMQSLDRWVIRTVFATLRDTDVIPPTAGVAINLSGQSLGDRRFLEFIEREIDQGGVPLERICFEITETAAITNLSFATRFFAALKPHGCRFALDDFGSGLSSFAYLKTLPVDFLKIDGRFVKDMADDPIDHAMVEAIHRIGHVMGIETIAEFVESAQVLDLLKEIGVDYAQGYLLGKPQPLSKPQPLVAAATS